MYLKQHSQWERSFEYPQKMIWYTKKKFNFKLNHSQWHAITIPPTFDPSSGTLHSGKSLINVILHA